jgi:hypothetical protein
MLCSILSMANRAESNRQPKKKKKDISQPPYSTPP